MACDSILFVDTMFVDTMEDHMLWNDITQIRLKQALRTAFDQETLKGSKQQLGKLTDAFRPNHPEPAELMGRAEENILAYKTFPKDHWPKRSLGENLFYQPIGKA